MKKLSLFLSVIMATSLVFSVSCVNKEVQVTETYYETEYRTEYKTESYTATEDVVVKTVEGSNSLSPKSRWKTAWVYLIGSEAKTTYYYGYDISTHEHGRGQVQVSFNLQSQMHKGVIYAIDLTDACYDKSIPFSGLLFGKDPTTPMAGGQAFVPAEGCQVIQPDVLGDIRVWLDGFSALTRNPTRILGTLSVDKRTTDDSSTFDAKGIKEFAIVIGIEPELRPPNVKLTWSDDIIEEKSVTKERQVPYEVPVQVEKQRTVMQTKKVPFWEVWKTNPPAETEPSSPSTLEAKPVVIETSPNTTTTEASPVTINDDFSNSNSGWGTGSDDWSKFAYEGGEYSISIERTNWFGYHLNSVSGMQGDFTVEVDAKKLSQKTDAAGIVFRDQRGQGKDSFYVFWVDSNSGTYAIHKYIKDVWAPDLKDFTPSNYINRGANTNRLKVVCKGSQIEVYANDYKLATVTDTSLTNGFIGLAVETFTSSNAHYHFDNFKLYTND
jgi:hypothetical protein